MLRRGGANQRLYSRHYPIQKNSLRRLHRLERGELTFAQGRVRWPTLLQRIERSQTDRCGLAKIMRDGGKLCGQRRLRQLRLENGIVVAPQPEPLACLPPIGDCTRTCGDATGEVTKLAGGRALWGNCVDHVIEGSVAVILRQILPDVFLRRFHNAGQDLQRREVSIGAHSLQHLLAVGAVGETGVFEILRDS